MAAIPATSCQPLSVPASWHFIDRTSTTNTCLYFQLAQSFATYISSPFSLLSFLSPLLHSRLTKLVRRLAQPRRQLAEPLIFLSTWYIRTSSFGLEPPQSKWSTLPDIGSDEAHCASIRAVPGVPIASPFRPIAIHISSSITLLPCDRMQVCYT